MDSVGHSKSDIQMYLEDGNREHTTHNHIDLTDLEKLTVLWAGLLQKLEIDWNKVYVYHKVFNILTCCIPLSIMCVHRVSQFHQE